MPKSIAKIIFLKEFHRYADDFNMICKAITFKDREGMIWNSPSEKSIVPKGTGCYYIKNLPGYLKFHYQEKAGLIGRKYPYIQGYAICLDRVGTATEYLHKFFKKKTRGNILRALRKLEKCFDISFESYYGQIDKLECQALLDQLKVMIIARFDRRGQVNEALQEWSRIEQTLHPWIQDRKASLFVIRNGQKPICISICYHYGPVLFSYVTSYDINYSKFSLGNIMIFKTLEWCFAEGGYRFIELGWGHLDYKARWSNTVHTFEHYHIFSKASLPIKTRGFIMGNYSLLIASLQNKWYYNVLKSIKAFIQDKINTKVPDRPEYQFACPELTEENENLLIPVNYEEYPELPLLEVRNHFIYLTEEYYQNISLLKDPEKPVFFLKSKKDCKRIVFGT